jgi:hypothetical protein
MALIKEIKEGLEHTLKKLLETLVKPLENNHMKLVYYRAYDRVMHQFSGSTLRKTPLVIRFSKDAG